MSISAFGFGGLTIIAKLFTSFALYYAAAGITVIISTLQSIHIKKIMGLTSNSYQSFAFLFHPKLMSFSHEWTARDINVHSNIRSSYIIAII